MKVRCRLSLALMLVGVASATSSASGAQLLPRTAGSMAAAASHDSGYCPAPNGDAYPYELSPSGTGARLVLPILVLLDGIPVREAERIVRDVGAMYRTMNITLSATYSPLPLKADGVAADRQPTYGVLAALDEMQRRYPRPPGNAVLVHLLTAKDLLDDNNPQRDGTDNGAGIADCIGGVRFVGEQFSVSEARWRAYKAGDPDDLNVIAMAHEIGHLLGAQHHYGNCSEGRTTTPGFTGSCTAMSPFGLANSEVFGTLERSVIRGYAEMVGTH